MLYLDNTAVMFGHDNELEKVILLRMKLEI